MKANNYYVHDNHHIWERELYYEEFYWHFPWLFNIKAIQLMLKRLPYTNTVIILGLFSMVAVFEPIRFLLTTDPLEDNDYVIKSSRHTFNFAII